MTEDSTLPTSPAATARPPEALGADDSAARVAQPDHDSASDSTPTASPTTMALEDMFRAYADDVYRYVRRRVDANDADDLTAEVFVTACRRLEDVPAGSELPWLYRTAWNLVSNHWRKQTPVSVAEVHETADEFDDFADLITESAVLRQAWDSLSSRDREVLRLVAWEGLDGAGLAAALGISVSGAGAAVWRARQHLRTAYDQLDAENTDPTQELPPPRHTPGETTARRPSPAQQPTDPTGGDR